VPFNADSFDAATFTDPVTGAADPAKIAAAFKILVREYNMRMSQIKAVGNAGYLVLRRSDLAPPEQKNSPRDLTRTVWETPIPEGDWVLPVTDPNIVGSEINPSSQAIVQKISNITWSIANPV
jgi:hypothetical protein